MQASQPTTESLQMPWWAAVVALVLGAPTWEVGKKLVAYLADRLKREERTEAKLWKTLEMHTKKIAELETRVAEQQQQIEELRIERHDLRGQLNTKGLELEESRGECGRLRERVSVLEEERVQLLERLERKN